MATVGVVAGDPEGSDGSQPSAAPAVSPTKARLARMTTGNMLRSMLPLVVMVLALAYFCTPQNVDPVTEVDPSSSVSYADSLTETELLIPVVGENWRPTSVEVTTPQGGAPEDPNSGRVTLTIGYLTPSQEFARYVVSTDPGSSLIENLLADVDAVDRVPLGGRSWERFTTIRGEPLYLATVGGLRLVITGSASQDELAALAGWLRPHPA